MSQQRCERSDLHVDQCGCLEHGGPTQRYVPETAGRPPPVYDGPRPRSGDILVSRAGVAHLPACDHLPDYRYLVPYLGVD